MLFRSLAAIMQDALQQQLQHNQVDAHRLWIKALLEDYYDPMYHYQHEKNKDRLRFSGNAEEVRAYLQESMLVKG